MAEDLFAKPYKELKHEATVEDEAPSLPTYKPVDPEKASADLATLNEKYRDKSMSETFQSGMRNTKNFMLGDALHAGVISKKEYAQSLAENTRLNEERDQNPAKLKLQKDIEEVKGFWNTTGEVLSSPFTNPEGVARMVVEQAGNMLPSIAGGLGGAAVGSLVGPVGSVVGGLGGMSAGTVATETGAELVSALQDMNVDLKDERAIIQALTPEAMDEALKRGLIRGSTIATVDLLTMGASKFLMGIPGKNLIKGLSKKGFDVSDPVKAINLAKESSDESVQKLMDVYAKSKKPMGRAKSAVAPFALEVAGEPAGEALAQVAVGDEVEGTDVALEAIGGLGASAVSTGVVSAYDSAKSFALDTKRKPNDVPAIDDEGKQTGWKDGDTGETYSELDVDNTGLPAAGAERTPGEATGPLDHALLNTGTDVQNLGGAEFETPAAEARPEGAITADLEAHPDWYQDETGEWKNLKDDMPDDVGKTASDEAELLGTNAWGEKIYHDDENGTYVIDANGEVGFPDDYNTDDAKMIFTATERGQEDASTVPSDTATKAEGRETKQEEPVSEKQEEAEVEKIEQADQVAPESKVSFELKNGDTATGTVTKIDKGVATINVDGHGTVKRRVDKLSSPTDSFYEDLLSDNPEIQKQWNDQDIDFIPTSEQTQPSVEFINKFMSNKQEQKDKGEPEQTLQEDIGKTPQEGIDVDQDLPSADKLEPLERQEGEIVEPEKTVTPKQQQAETDKALADVMDMSQEEFAATKKGKQTTKDAPKDKELVDGKVERDAEGRTEAQKSAGNYKMVHKKVSGLDISIENEKGTTRSGTDEGGKAWEVSMKNDYGYIKRTKGADGDHVDIFIGSNKDSDKIFIVNQTNKDGSFDEHKVLAGFNSKKEAEQGYLDNYEKGWSNYNDIVETNSEGFKKWLDKSSQKKPAAFDVKAETTKPVDVKKPEDVIDKKVEINPVLRKNYINGRFGKNNIDWNKTVEPYDVVYLKSGEKYNAKEKRGELKYFVDEKVSEVKSIEKPATKKSEEKSVKKQTVEDEKQVSEKKSPKLTKAQNQFDKDMAELGGAIFEVLSMKVIPSDRKPEFTRLLTNVMGSALNLGYTKFKENAKYVLDIIGKKFGKDAADLFDLQMLQGAYLGATSGEKGAETINDVATVTLEDIKKTEVDENGLLHDDTGRDAEAGKITRGDTKRTDGEVSPTNKQRKKPSGDKVAKEKPTQLVGPTTESDRKPSDRSGAVKYQGRSRDDLRNNHRIESQEDLAAGSAYQIAKSNLDAIKIAKRIASSDNDTALPEEKAILAKYAGWGAGDIRNKVFQKNNKPEGRWKEIYDQLDEMLTPAEMKTMKKSTQYAHYTSKSVVDAMYKAIEGFGFKSGSVFEGGVGSGNFMGLIPQKFTVPNYTGVEMDSITADIAQALYPDNRVIKGDFSKITLPPNHFALVIGNPPFADVRYPLNGNKMMLHDYFIAKQLDALAPGKVAAFVTSTGTMDKVDSSVREYIAENSVLLGAVRLPNDAFKASAGTGVVTDILFFQKKHPDQSITGVDWIGSNKAPTVDVNINDYFIANPNNMLGTPGLGGTFQNRFDLKSNGNTEQQLNDAIDSLPKDVIAENPTIKEVQKRSDEFEIAPSEADSYYYVDNKGMPRINQGGLGVIVQNRKQHGLGKTAKQMEMVKDYIPLRDALMKVMKSQGDDKAWKSALKELNEQYDNFTKNHGPLNQVREIKRKDGVIIYQQPVTSALEDDAEFFRVMTTEQYNEVTGKGIKGDVFTNQLFGKDEPVQINSAEDALSVTLNEKGYLDMHYMQEIYGQSEKDIISELGQAVYSDPLTGQYITADEYLSGNVKAKLRQAEEFGIQRNIADLKKVIPEDKPLSEIPINLGAFWIKPETVKRFAEEKMDFTGNVSNVIRGENSSWSVIGTAENTSEFGTAEKTPAQILDAALNRRTIKITTKDVDGKTIVLVAESTAANEKVKALRDAFSQWALNDSQASEEMHEVYNRDFNTTVPRKYNGDMLTLPGLSSKYSLHDWQKNVVWRIIQNGNTYMAHTVGSGKTLASIVAGMELKRLGLAKKPSYVVLKSTLKQFAAEFYDAYPNAKLLIADENQLNPRNRRHFMGKVANENWDAVIITHQSFEKIPMGDQFIKDYIEKQIAEYEATLEELDETDLPNRRNIENTIEKMEAQLEDVAAGAGKDKGITFEDAGIDHLFVDEAHTHKKVQFPTTQNDLKGIDPTGSKIAMDLFLKSRYLNTIKPNKNLVMMSGTAVTNTINEFFNIQRFLQPDVLESQGVSSFDSWSSTFAESSTSYEMKANGEFHPVTRLNKFVGLPGFLRDFLQVADIVGDKELEESTTIKNRPTLKNNSRDIQAIPIGESMKGYMLELDARIKALENKKGPPKKGEDNILVVMNDGQNAAIDMRLVNKVNDVPSKLDVMINEAFNSWEDMSNAEYNTNGKPDPIKGNVQLIFTKTRKSSKSHFDVYNHIRDTLISKGVPASEIAFIQNYGDSKKKKRLFNDVNNGKIRFVLGGTTNLGTGTNVQKRLSKIHHLSIDYRPSDLKQREGRMIRQGNQNKDVESIAYAAEGTIDAFMWGMLENKAAMIDKAMAGDLSINRIADVSDDANMLAMAKAIASGNPALLEIAELTSDVKRLRMMESSFVNQRFNAKKTLRQTERAKEEIKGWKEETESSPTYKETAGDLFNAELSGNKYTDRKRFLDALNTLPKQKAGPIGKVGNQEIFIDNNQQVSFNEGRETVYIGGTTIASSYNLNVAPVKLTGSLSHGAVKRIENIARKYSNVNQDMNEELKKVSKREENAQRILDSEFDKTAELNDKSDRLLELEDSLKSTPESEELLTDEDIVKDIDLFSRSKPTEEKKKLPPLTKTALVSAINKVFSKIKGGGARDIVFPVNTFTDLPQAAQDVAKDQGSDGTDVNAVFHNGKIYIVGDQMTSDLLVEQTLFHEATHNGIDAVLKDRRVKHALNQLMFSLGGVRKFNDIVDEFGIDLKKYRQGVNELKDGKPVYSPEQKRAILLEELIAFTGEQGSKTFKLKVKEVLGAIKQWLRTHGFPLLARSITGNDIAYLARLSREQGLGEKDNRNKVTRLMVALHGTPHGVDDFDKDTIWYHGTSEEFDFIKADMDEAGAWFTTKYSTAGSYAKGSDAKVYATYLKTKNTFTADFSENFNSENKITINGDDFYSNIDIVTYAKNNGYDSVHFPEGNFSEDDNTMVVFSDNQIMEATNLEQDERYNDITRFMLAWHGTPHYVDEFTTEKIGTGEGAQAQGWGIYMAGERGVAEFYRDKLKKPGTKGNLYGVDLKPEDNEYLDWDKPLTKQSKHVKDAIINMGMGSYISDEMTGSKFYETLSNFYKSEAKDDWMVNKSEADKQASIELLEAGIRGNRYMDAASRTGGEGDSNYVIFSDEDVEITTRFSRSGENNTNKWLDRGQGKSPLTEDEKLNRQIREQNKTLWDKTKRTLKRNLTAGGLLPENVQKLRVTRDGKIGAVEIDMGQLVRGLEKAVGKPFHKLTPVEEQRINNALIGDVDPKLSAPIKTAIFGMRQYIDSLSSDYAQTLFDEVKSLQADNKNEAAAARAGLLEIIAKNMGEYVHRSYKAFDDPKWANKVPSEVLNNAREYLKGQYQKQADELEKKADIAETRKKPDDELAQRYRDKAGDILKNMDRRTEATLNTILKDGTAYDNMEAFIRESKLGAKDLSILKRRKEISPEILALLGQYTDPRVNFTKSATKMSRLVFNQRFLNKVKEVGMGSFLFTEKDRPADAHKRIAESESYSPLSGLYTYPDVDLAFRDALGKEDLPDWYRTLVQINGMVKYGKTVLSPTTAARNWMSAFFFAMANGHFNMKHMKKSLENIRGYFKHEGDLSYLRELKELGVVYDTPYAGEMMKLLEDSAIEEKYLSGNITFKETMGMFTKFYQYGDDFWKIIGYENEINLLMKHKGITKEQAKPLAAERIRDTYPTYSMTGRWVQKLRRFPLAGTFVSFPAEIIRTTFNMFHYLHQDMQDPKLKSLARQRIAGLAIVSGFTYALQGLAMSMLGIDDDEEEAIRNLAAPWNKNSNIMPTSRDKDGNIRFIDLSFLDPYNYFKRPLNALMRDQPIDDMMKESAREMLTPFFGTDITFGAISEIWHNKKSTGGRVYNPAEDSLENAQSIANHLRKNVQPGIASLMERTIKAISGTKSPSGKVYNLPDEMMGAIGWRITTFDPKQAIYYKTYEFSDKVSDAHKIVNREIRSQNKVSDSDLRTAYKATMTAHKKAYNDMIILVSAAKKSGLTNREIYHMLKSGGVSKKNIGYLLRGLVPAWVPSKNMARSASGITQKREIIKRINKILVQKRNSDWDSS